MFGSQSSRGHYRNSASIHRATGPSERKTHGRRSIKLCDMYPLGRIQTSARSHSRSHGNRFVCVPRTNATRNPLQRIAQPSIITAKHSAGRQRAFRNTRTHTTHTQRSNTACTCAIGSRSGRNADTRADADGMCFAADASDWLGVAPCRAETRPWRWY